MANFNDELKMAQKIEIERREADLKKSASNWLSNHEDFFTLIKEALVAEATEFPYAKDLKVFITIPYDYFDPSDEIKNIKYLFQKKECAKVLIEHLSGGRLKVSLTIE